METSYTMDTHLPLHTKTSNVILIVSHGRCKLYFLVNSSLRIARGRYNCFIANFCFRIRGYQKSLGIVNLARSYGFTAVSTAIYWIRRYANVVFRARLLRGPAHFSSVGEYTRFWTNFNARKNATVKWSFSVFACAKSLSASFPVRGFYDGQAIIISLLRTHEYRKARRYLGNTVVSGIIISCVTGVFWIVAKDFAVSVAGLPYRIRQNVIRIMTTAIYGFIPNLMCRGQ